MVAWLTIFQHWSRGSTQTSMLRTKQWKNKHKSTWNKYITVIHIYILYLFLIQYSLNQCVEKLIISSYINPLSREYDMGRRRSPGTALHLSKYPTNLNYSHSLNWMLGCLSVYNLDLFTRWDPFPLIGRWLDLRLSWM